MLFYNFNYGTALQKFMYANTLQCDVQLSLPK